MSGTRPAPARPSPGPVAVPRPATPAAAAKPAFSPFEQNQQRGKYDRIQSHENSGANALAPAPAPVAGRSPQPISQPQPISAPQPAPEPLRMPDPAPVVEPPVSAQIETPAEGDDIPAIQKAIVEALIAAGQGAAADAIEDSTLTAAAGELNIQTQISKTMLSVHINAEAEKIVKAAIRHFALTRLQLLPGARAVTADRTPRAAKAGSAKAKAMEHPLVQRGRELFEAEIQTVIDLSETGS
jgi:DNA polymerase-3 subunit gamma/tau